MYLQIQGTKSLVETSLDIFLGFLMFLPVNYFVLPLFAEPDSMIIILLNCDSDRCNIFYNFAYSQVHTKALV